MKEVNQSSYSKPAIKTQSCHCFFFLDSITRSMQWYLSLYLAELWVDMGMYCTGVKVCSFKIYSLSFTNILMLLLLAVNRKQMRLNQVFLQRRTYILFKIWLSWSMSSVSLRYSLKSLSSLLRKVLKIFIIFLCKFQVLSNSFLPLKAGTFRKLSSSFLCISNCC